MTRREFGGSLLGGLAASRSSSAFADPDFTLVAIPDPQYIAQDCTGTYDAMMNRIIADQAAYNIKAVLGEGDLLHVPATTSNASAVVVINAFSLLDSVGIPHISCMGNHDLAASGHGDRTNNGWHFRPGSYFGAAAAKARIGSGIPIGGARDMACWVGSYDPYSGSSPTQDATNSGACTAIRLLIGRRKLLVIALPYFADSPSLLQAKAWHDTYAPLGYEVIMLSHGYLTTHPADTTPLTRLYRWGPGAGTPMAAAPYSNSGLEQWYGYNPSTPNDPSDSTWPGFRSLSNHILTIGGHVIDALVGSTYYDGTGTQYLTNLDLTNTAGNVNHGIMCNLQQRDSNADTANSGCTANPATFGDDRAHLMYMRFSPANATLKLQILSTNTGKWAGSLTVPTNPTPYCASATPVDLMTIAYPGIAGSGSVTPCSIL